MTAQDGSSDSPPPVRGRSLWSRIRERLSVGSSSRSDYGDPESNQVHGDVGSAPTQKYRPYT
jgi:hypothetical protein